MGLSCEVNDGINLMPAEQIAHKVTIAYIALNKSMPLRAR